jgi:uncharacterized protein YwgA
MKNELRIPAIVSLLATSRVKLGKIQLQKLVYFAQNNGLPLKYTFQIHNYGPYSFELSNDLGSLDALEIVNVQNDPNGHGFQISTGKFADKFILPVKYQKKLERIIDQFGSEKTATLEVKATIHFVSSVVKGKREIVQKVHALKPRLTKEFIRQSYSELKQMNWV